MQVHDHGADPQGQAEAPGAYKWWALFLLTAIYACHALDRMILSVVMEPLKHEFHLSDGAVGFLNGFAHAGGFVLTVLPLGVIVDKVNRARLLSGLVILWSVMTLACGAATSALSLGIARAGVGAAEGGGASASMSLITDYFSRRQRGLAVGLFYTSTAIGVGVIFLFGGMIVSHFGWRMTFFAAGAPGLVLGVLALLSLREPPRGRYDAAPPRPRDRAGSARQILRAIVTTPPLALSMVGLTLGTMVTSGIWGWAVSFFARVHGLPVQRSGLVMAIAVGLIQAIALPLAGKLSDKLSQGRPERIHVVSAAGLLLGVPALLLMFLAPSLPLAVVGTLFLGLTSGAWLGQTYGAVASLSPPNIRGGVFAVSQLGTNLLGTGLGAALVGMLSDAYGGPQSLRWALCTTGLLNLPAAFCLMAAMWWLRRKGSAASTGALAAQPAG